MKTYKIVFGKGCGRRQFSNAAVVGANRELGWLVKLISSEIPISFKHSAPDDV